MKRPARVALTSLLVAAMWTLVIPAFPRTAQADEPAAANGKPSAADVEEAKKHYARGVALYNQKADAAARAELERAYALAPNWKVLYNLGLVELQMNDFASALRSFERYLEGGGDALGAARQREVVGRVALLRDQVATLDVKVNAEGAEVLLDDLAVGSSPLAAPIVVNPGHYKLSASKGGHSAESKAVNVTGGDHAVIELAIEEPAPIAAASLPPPVQAPASPIPSPDTSEPTPPVIEVKPAPPEMPDPNAAKKRAEAMLWIGWGTTGALAAGAAVSGIVALGANSDLTHAKSDRPASSAELDRLSSRAHTFAAVSDALTIGAIAAAGVSLYLTLRSNHAWSTSPKSPAASMRSTGPMRSVDVAVGPASFAVSGTF